MRSPVLDDVGVSNGNLIGKGIAGFISEFRENFLKTEIRRFLKHQLLRAKHRVGDREGQQPRAAVLVLEPESVLGIFRLRNHAKISQLGKILRH